MEYPDYSQTRWQQPPFPSPVSPGSYFFPPQQQPSPASDARQALSLNLTGLSVASPPSLSPHQPQPAQLHPAQLHHHSSSLSGPITPVSPPLLSPQPQFYNAYDDPLNPDLLNQRRPSTGDLAPEKSVPRKRSLTNAPVHQHSYSSPQQTLPHPIITTTASSPPLPTSSASSPSSHPSHSRSLSHSHSHSSLQVDLANPTSPYDDLDSAGPTFPSFGEDASDDDLGSPSGANPGSKPSSSGQQGQSVVPKSGTNNFVTKLHNMINDSKSQHFISWTDMGSSFVVSNVGEFSRNILGSHFKHNNFSSFVRQLNMYGFHKINRTPRAQRTSATSQTWEFSHPKFLRGRADLLEAIKRKALEPDPRERNRVELPGEVVRLLSDLRAENGALWREIKSLSSRLPPATNPGGSQSRTSPNPQVGEHGLSHSRSSSNLGDDGEGEWDPDEDVMSASVMTSVTMGGSQGGEEWDPQSPGFNLGATGGLNVPGLAFNAFEAQPGEEWRRWAENEIHKERKRVEKLVGIVKALVDSRGAGLTANIGTTPGMELDGISPNILQELHELSLSFDNSPSPVPMGIPSPSPSPSPHSFARHPHSPNIFITSPTSPTPFATHSRSTSRDSQHRSAPTALSIANSMANFHSPTSSPTASDIVPNYVVSQRSGHARSLSHLGLRTQRPNITLTLETGDRGHVEKRARTENKVKDGEAMEVVPNEAGEDVKLSSPISLTNGTTGNKVVGLRSRSDSAPMWGGEQGGLSATWTGRGRSGSSFGQ